MKNISITVGYKKYIENVKATARRQHKKIPLVKYNCPDCDKIIEALVPSIGEVYDSGVLCPWCGGHHYKKVYGDRTVRIFEMPRVN